MRTVVNVNAGGKTRLSGLIHGLFLVSVLFGLGKFAALIPLSVLSGILITVGVGIIDYKGLRHLRRVPRADAVVLLIVLSITSFRKSITCCWSWCGFSLCSFYEKDLVILSKMKLH